MLRGGCQRADHDSLVGHRDRRNDRLRFARRLRRRALRRLRRSSSAWPGALAASPATARAPSPSRDARRQCAGRSDHVVDVGGDDGDVADAGRGDSDADDGAEHDAHGGAEDGYPCGEPYDEAGRVASRPGYPAEPAARSRPFGRVSLAPPFASLTARSACPAARSRSPPCALPSPAAGRSTAASGPPPRSPRAGASRHARRRPRLARPSRLRRLRASPPARPGAPVRRRVPALLRSTPALRSAPRRALVSA